MRSFVLIFAAAVALTSCNWINPSEETPSFIRVESIGFNASSTQGTESQNFVDAWIYIDGKSVGAYELPCTLPVLAEGEHTFEIIPGIMLNGISNTRAIYPFVKPWTSTINLVKDSVVEIHPVSSYYDEIVFETIEDFESGGITIGETTFSDTIMQRTDDPSIVFEGGYSGMLAVDTQHDTIVVKSNSAYVLPTAGEYNFLELNFRTEAPLVVGVISNTGTQSVFHEIVVLNETDIWKKVYVNLTTVTAREYDASSFYYFMWMRLPEGKTEARAYIDNVKLIHAE